MSGFVKSDHAPKVKSGSAGMKYAEFHRRLKEQDVCVISMSNAPQWFQEVPIELQEAYLHLRDHRHLGALLHEDALAHALFEKEMGRVHPFTQ